MKKSNQFVLRLFLVFFASLLLFGGLKKGLNYFVDSELERIQQNFETDFPAFQIPDHGK